METWRQFVNTLETCGSKGCWPSPPDQRDYKYDLLVPEAAALPSEVDYRNNLPPVRNQGSLGTCVAASCAWTLKPYQEITQGDCPASGFSAAYLHAMCKQLDGIPGTSGTYIRTAMQVLQKYGVCPEDRLPYSWLTRDKNVPAPPDGTHALADPYRISTYAQLCAMNDADRSTAVESIKKAIANEGPVIAGLLVCENFLEPKDGIIPLPEGRIRGGHAVALVGYSDARRCFILRNSWGQNWGINGHALLPYKFVTTRLDIGWALFEAWTTVDVVVPKAAKQVVLTIGKDTAVVDGNVVLLDQPPVVTEKWRTLVPVRFVAGNLGYLVKYDENTQQVILTKPY